MTYAYRILEHVYRNSLQDEDGPGSLQNVVSKEKVRTLKIWTGMTEERWNKMTQNGIRRGDCYLQASRLSGWIDYSYEIQRHLEKEGAEWEFVGFIESNAPAQDDRSEDE